ncbi:type VII secretion target [Pseudosporangium ferrugineum]|uniref:Excreted virulence factor EspC (Type VII ESX diderm) n=1 Tax=Pseudosporangium ferrugineum TaxID=439699 RepID=A0A2T0RX98_9ACTN|nr:type VII secretion target [Pseudosporangium ferrugineum]PRY25816.1 excreted virulence factor EspC (type VII ESX diderm) [Pseudosporangium ferrugineum]
MTSPGKEFQVDSAALRAHAGEVDRIGDGLTTAAQAGETVRTGAGAYGQLCQIVPALLNSLQQAMVDGMATAAASAHDTADALRAVAADYDETDRGAADRLHGTR